MWHIQNMRQFFVLCLCPCLCLCACLCLIGCADVDPRRAQAARDRSRVDSVAQAVRAAPRAAATGRWDLPRLTERLVNAGLAPHPDDSLPSHPDYKTAPVGFRLGSAHLLVWMYRDSLARRAVSASIDTLTAIPRGQPSPFAEPPMFVLQNNLIAVVVGGTERQRERIRLAIEAGLSLPPG